MKTCDCRRDAGDVQLTVTMRCSRSSRSRSAQSAPRRHRYDVGSKAESLPSTVELAAQRVDLGPNFLPFFDELGNRPR